MQTEQRVAKMTDVKFKTVEERLAYLEAKLERLDKVEEQLRRTQQALQRVTAIYDRNFAIVTGKIANKSDGFISDLFNW
jgi:glutaredoxin 2